MKLLERAIDELTGIQSRDLTEEVADSLLTAIMDNDIITWRFSLTPIRLFDDISLTTQDQHRNLCAQFNNYIVEKVLPVASDEKCVTFILLHAGRTDLKELASQSVHEILLDTIKQITSTYRYVIQ